MVNLILVTIATGANTPRSIGLEVEKVKKNHSFVKSPEIVFLRAKG
jgi:hypothetical protein